MRILSIDVGMKNLAVCIIETSLPDIHKISFWDVLDLCETQQYKCKEIMIEGLPLGGLKNEKFSMLKMPFQKGDVLVMLSDGLPEASNENNEMYDYERIKDLITKNHFKEAEEIKSKFFSSLDSWLNGGIPDDDVTLVIVKKVA